MIVLSYQPGEWLAPCLASALDQELDRDLVPGGHDRGVEVLCIDNGSAEGVASALAAPTGARVLRSERNLGFAGGVNLGLRHARGRHIALLNDDAVAGAGWLNAASAALEDPAVAAVGPKVRMAGWWQEVRLGDTRTAAPGDHRQLGTQLGSVHVGGREVLDQAAGGGLHRLEAGGGRRWRWTVPSTPFYVPVAGPSGDSVEVDGRRVAAGPVVRLVNKAGSYLRADGILGDYGAETPDDGRFDRGRECFFASGTALVATERTWAAVGPLADPFFAYYEDGDWCWRARLLGLAILYDATSVVEHRVSATSGGPVSSRVRYLAERNRSLCLLRNAPRRVAAAELRRRVNDGPLDGVRRGVLSATPWALRTRARMRRRRVVDPGEVWERWAGTDTVWEGGPPEG